MCDCSEPATRTSRLPERLTLVDEPPFIRLTKLGFSTAYGLEVAVKNYQDFHGLEISGELDASTQRSLDTPRFCGFPDVMAEQLGENLCQWKSKDPVTGQFVVTWSISAYLPRLTRDQLKEAYTIAWANWAAVCNIKPVFVDNPANAMVQMGARTIDSSGGVLAESELPCGNAKLCRQWYDTSESWVASDSPAQGQIDIIRVATHELGHACGLNHGPSGNLMAPTYSLTVSKPRSWDISEMQTRYGPPLFVPPVPPVPPDWDLVIRIKGNVIDIPGYRVTKL